MMNYQVFETPDHVVTSLAETLLEYSKENRPVHISLSGGSTPALLFKTLAQAPWAESIAWQNLHFWWGDERCVGPEDPESNYGKTKALLFDHIAIPAENIHRIRGENFAAEEAGRFAEEMLTEIPQKDGVPAFDWVILGMGTDGHTASLFPGQTDYDTTEIAAVAAHPENRQIRVTKTAHLIRHAKRITYLVMGASKASVIKEIHDEAEQATAYPAAQVKAIDGLTEWYLDSEAAQELA
ncbi:6-phosphogluconolactonase [Photobacterium atrarenae]|uniref:6-phosphogluconolactonase n=1 Tax=Photobacterium atrarenae TaxID=865757 RepID=A0ABY5GBR8_9GAMM|nr:6-phosphogluconolactonase [Photobacterium atrarenae]UTV26625.1 6-phosphogluconolactonase [Photobacterium atrarenae]